jgi:nitroreductase
MTSNNVGIQAIYERASVRSFQTKEIPKETIIKLLEAGTFAPSSGNMQPWEFIIVQSPEQKKKLVTCTFFGYFSKGANYQHWLADAGVIIVACANVKRTVARYGEAGKDWASIDTAAAVENILLTAVSLGLAGCWVGGFREKELKDLLQIPPYVKPIGLIPIGYPAEQTKRKYRMPLKWVTHDGEYNQPYITSNRKE